MPTQYIYSFTEPIKPEDLHNLFQQTDWADTRSPLDIQQMLDHCQITLGVWDEDRLIAFVRVLTDDRFRALIDDVVVDSAHRNLGVASLMLEKLLMRMQHIEVIMLDCDLELSAFYSRFGFSPKESTSMVKYNPH